LKGLFRKEGSFFYASGLFGLRAEFQRIFRNSAEILPRACFFLRQIGGTTFGRYRKLMRF
jgi:hypothetical protein